MGRSVLAPSISSILRRPTVVFTAPPAAKVRTTYCNMAGDQARKRKKYPMSRKDYRERVEETKRRRVELGEEGPAVWQDTFTEEEIKNEPRRKRYKVAIIFGYAGTGYHGLQIARDSPTIEGDLFRACVRAGAVSKANSDDPKKVSWVRCSRTDRNVHAAANVISAQMIVEDADIVERINGHLPPQIRVWGTEKLNKTFNAHQRCEGRVYQYWIPTFCFVPPHPRSFLGIQLAELAQESGHADEYTERQREVVDFWTKAEDEYIAPVLKQFDPEVGTEALHAIFDPHLKQARTQGGGGAEGLEDPAELPSEAPSAPSQTAKSKSSTVDQAGKALKEAYKAARRSYRIDSARLERVKACLGEFQGTHNFWNYTFRKTANDASARRYISRTAVGESTQVGGTEWLPLDIHGQSFMLNQIRKMAFMVAMVVRCGSLPSLIQETFAKETRLNVPKAPPAGLLLERPIFDAFNASLDRLPESDERSRIDFEKFRAQIEAFKREHILTPVHELEEQEAMYYNFFLGLDSLRSNQLLYFSTAGIPATKRQVEGEEALDEKDDEDEAAAAAQGGDDG